jgi:hypothetical protein
MNSRDLCFYLVAKLENKQKDGLTGDEVLELQQIIASVLVTGAYRAGANRDSLPDPEKIGDNITFKELTTALIVSGAGTQED